MVRARGKLLYKLLYAVKKELLIKAGKARGRDCPLNGAWLEPSLGGANVPAG